MASRSEPAAPGLRERKKARTRAAIQRHALRLFRRQGYDATKVSQIAEAADVSESTFFRYFPTKEQVVMWDDFDPLIIDELRAQPAESTPVQALRAAFGNVFARLSTEERAQLRERVGLMLSIAPLRAVLLDQINGPMRVLAEAIAERTGRHPRDPAVRAVVGAVLGVGLSAMLTAADDPNADLIPLLDTMLSHLETGFPFPAKATPPLDHR